ncbi:MULTISPECIES: hypothetical protein [Niastella]|uniref:hypothetical protein n=1 Tax=Niastella TaxID=354354 RepID=UPI001ADBFCA0|nr:hypothetical protein [Niastella soli]
MGLQNAAKWLVYTLTFCNLFVGGFMTIGQWAVGHLWRQTADGKRQTADGKRQTANGRRQTANGRRQTAGGRRQTLLRDILFSWHL